MVICVYSIHTHTQTFESMSSRAFCMHSLYILCCVYGVHNLFIYFCSFVCCFSPLWTYCMLLTFSVVLLLLYRIQKCSVLLFTSMMLLLMLFLMPMLVVLDRNEDELRHAVSMAKQIKNRMAVRWWRCHCWCIELSVHGKRPNAQCNTINAHNVRLCLYLSHTHTHTLRHWCNNTRLTSCQYGHLYV